MALANFTLFSLLFLLFKNCMVFMLDGRLSVASVRSNINNLIRLRHLLISKAVVQSYFSLQAEPISFHMFEYAYELPSDISTMTLSVTYRECI